MTKCRVFSCLLLAFCATAFTQTAPQTADSIQTELTRLHCMIDSLAEAAPQETIAAGRRALKLAQRLGDTLQTARAYMDIGMGFENIDAYDSALEYYLKALSFYEQTGDKPCMAHALNAIGFIYWYMGDNDHALSYYHRSITLYRLLDIPEGVARNLNHQGLIYWRQRRWAKALDHYFQSLALFEKHGPVSSQTALLNNIGLVYQDMEEHNKALAYYRRALKMNRKAGKQWSLIENYNNIGRTYISLPDYEKAATYLTQARTWAEKIESRYLLIDNHLHFYNLYLAQGNLSKALLYHQRYTSLKDSLTSDRVRANIAGFQTQYEIEKREGEIKLLKAEQALNEARIRAHKQWIHFLITVSAVVGLASIVFYIQRFKTRQAYNHLARRTQELVASEKKVRTLKTTEPKAELTPEAESGKYSGSSLTEAQKQEISDNLADLMEAHQFYLNHDLTINRVADELHISRTYLSQVINEKFSQSFVNYINGLRIREACHLLSEDLNRLYTIEAISKQVGFNSTNVFNKAFKRSTGVTPSFYIKTLQVQKNTPVPSQ